MLILQSPPNPENDTDFRNLVPEKNKINELIDDNLIYSVYKDAVDFLITNDNGIHKKALRLNIQDRIFSIEEAYNFILFQYKDVEIQTAPPSLKEESLHNLDLKDPFFNSLREDYSNFDEWFKKKSRMGKTAWVHIKNDGGLGAFLMLKDEHESINCHPIVKTGKRLKIATLKVTLLGFKLGELLLKIAIEYAIKKRLNEIYLTHFTQENDYLLPLIEDFGFEQIGIKDNGEIVYMKKLLAPVGCHNPLSISKIYYPSFYDGTEVKKYIVPIQPVFHDLLFQDWNENNRDLFDEHYFIPEANTIKKAYICHSQIKRIQQGDILLFYRSGDVKSITSLGVVENVYYNARNTDEIRKIVGKRTVYTNQELIKMSEKPTIILLFRWHFHLHSLICFDELLKHRIVNGAIQSITSISNQKYLVIKEKGKFNGRFIIN